MEIARRSSICTRAIIGRDTWKGNRKAMTSMDHGRFPLAWSTTAHIRVVPRSSLLAPHSDRRPRDATAFSVRCSTPGSMKARVPQRYDGYPGRLIVGARRKKNLALARKLSPSSSERRGARTEPRSVTRRPTMACSRRVSTCMHATAWRSTPSGDRLSASRLGPRRSTIASQDFLCRTGSMGSRIASASCPAWHPTRRMCHCHSWCHRSSPATG